MKNRIIIVKGAKVILSNLEPINAVLIQQGLAAPERLAQLNALAVRRQLAEAVGLPRIGRERRKMIRTYHRRLGRCA